MALEGQKSSSLTTSKRLRVIRGWPWVIGGPQMLSVLGCGWCQARMTNLWVQPRGLGHRKHKVVPSGRDAVLCLPQSRGSGPRAPAPPQLGSPRGAACSAQLTLHPKCEELLHGARRVLGHTHVAGSVGHLCRGNLWCREMVPDGCGPPSQEPLGGTPHHTRHGGHQEEPRRRPPLSTWSSV